MNEGGGGEVNIFLFFMTGFFSIYYSNSVDIHTRIFVIPKYIKFVEGNKK